MGGLIKNKIHLFPALLHQNALVFIRPTALSQGLSHWLPTKSKSVSRAHRISPGCPDTPQLPSALSTSRKNNNPASLSTSGPDLFPALLCMAYHSDLAGSLQITFAPAPAAACGLMKGRASRELWPEGRKSTAPAFVTPQIVLFTRSSFTAAGEWTATMMSPGLSISCWRGPGGNYFLVLRDSKGAYRAGARSWGWKDCLVVFLTDPDKF